MKNIRQLSVILLLFCMATSFAQQRGKSKEKMEQVKALKVAFITNELQLSPEEAARFWPLYNAFEEKQREIRWEKVNTILGARGNAATDKLTEKEAAVLLAQMEENEEQLYQLRKKFVASLKGVLPSVKIIKLKKAEEDFNKKLLQQYRQKRGK